MNDEQLAKFKELQSARQVLTDDEISTEYNQGDNNGWLEFARAIEYMTIEAYKKKIAKDIV
jgi:DnaJ-class molecular chaperone